MAPSIFPIPGVEHGKRILTTVIEDRAKGEEPWLSLPIDDTNLSLGFKDLTYKQLNNAANHAAHWLNENLPSSEPFQCFAYAGPKDLRWPILAVAAAKAQKVMVLPSPLVTPEAQLKIFEKKDCKLYLRPEEAADSVAGILKDAPHVETVTFPPLDQFFNETEATPVNYPKTWQEGKDDPWMVFHTSGTTGNPKAITYSHQTMAAADMTAAMANDIPESHFHQYACSRFYTPMPSLHFVGMLRTISITTFTQMVAVIGPSGPPSPDVVAQVLQYGRLEGAVLPPALVDALCLAPTGLQALQGLKYVHYAGAPLSDKSAELLLPHVQIVPCVGSTEGGGYFTVIHGNPKTWDYLCFQKQAGAVFEHRMGDLHELVLVRDPTSNLQQIFTVYPHLDRFETNDLWVEHPTEKGLWKIIGRSDDYVCFSHGEGLHASLLEPEITSHPRVKTALIGGNGKPGPVLLVELNDSEDADESSREEFLDSLQPYLEKLNARCHHSVKISSDRVIVASKEKPFAMTVKGSVARLVTMKQYEDEIAALFS